MCPSLYLSLSSMTLQSQFASLLEAWGNAVVEKISMILKVSVCEASPDGQRAGLDDNIKQKNMNPKLDPQSSGPRKSEPCCADFYFYTLYYYYF